MSCFNEIKKKRSVALRISQIKPTGNKYQDVRRPPKKGKDFYSRFNTRMNRNITGLPRVFRSYVVGVTK